MDDLSSGYEWAKTYGFDEEELQYCTIIALNILDGEACMDYDSQNILMSVYDGIAERIPSPLNKKVHQIIEMSRTQDPIIPKEELKDIIHNIRVSMLENIDEDSLQAFEQFIWEKIT